jgi:hypothetical protein
MFRPAPDRQISADLARCDGSMETGRIGSVLRSGCRGVFSGDQQGVFQIRIGVGKHPASFWLRAVPEHRQTNTTLARIVTIGSRMRRQPGRPQLYPYESWPKDWGQWRESKDGEHSGRR